MKLGCINDQLPVPHATGGNTGYSITAEVKPQYVWKKQNWLFPEASAFWNDHILKRPEWREGFKGKFFGLYDTTTTLLIRQNHLLLLRLMPMLLHLFFDVMSLLQGAVINEHYKLLIIMSSTKTQTPQTLSEVFVAPSFAFRASARQGNKIISWIPCALCVSKRQV